MLFTSIVGALLAQSLAASAATMQVTVGANNQFTFTPGTINAQPGDTVNFNFVSANHSVVSSNANSPCQPQKNAVFSDFQPVSAAATGKGKGKAKKAKNNIVNARAGNMPTFSVPVTDNQPMYIYCSQAQHCQQGMVMVINPPAAGQGVTLNQYASMASQAQNNVSPKGGVSGGTVTNSQAGKKAAATGGNGKGKAKAAGGAAGALAGLVGKAKGNN